MGKTTAYKIAGSHVVHDSIDGETIVINLETGDYFSLDKGGSWIWMRIATGCSADDLCNSPSFSDQEDKANWAQGTISFLAKLKELGLVKIVDGESSATAPPDVDSEESVAEFAPPTLQHYTDMQELLALDPIHEVDDAGWPRGKEH